MDYSTKKPKKLLLFLVALIAIAPATAYLYIDTTPIDLTHGIDNVTFEYQILSNTTEPVECQLYIDTDVWGGSWDYKEVTIHNYFNLNPFYNDNLTHYWWVCCIAYDINQGNCTGDINGPIENFRLENYFAVNDLTMMPLPNGITGYVSQYGSEDIAPVIIDGGTKTILAFASFTAIIAIIFVVAIGTVILRKMKGGRK